MSTPSPQLLRFRGVIRFIRDNPGCRKQEIQDAVPGLTDREWRAFKESTHWTYLAFYMFYPTGWFSPLSVLQGGPLHDRPKDAGHNFSESTSLTALEHWEDLESGRWPGQTHGRNLWPVGGAR